MSESQVPDPVQPQAVETTAEPAETPEPQAVPEPQEPQEPQLQSALKRWKFLLVLLPVWIPAAGVGLALYYWWFHSLHKTGPLYVVLMFVVVCTVAGLLIAVMGRKPVVSGLAVAVMTAPYAATIAAAVLHGLYYCDSPLKPHCLIGLIPY